MVPLIPPACLLAQQQPNLSACRVESARRRSRHPPRKPVRNIRRIAVRRNTRLQQPRSRDGARIVDPRRFVVLANIRRRGRGQALLQPVSGARPHRPIGDHLRDLRLRTRILHTSTTVTSACPVVRLHQPRVRDAAVGRPDAHAAFALLQRDGEDEAGVDAARGSDARDGGLEVGVLVVGVVGFAELGAGGGEDDEVGGPHAFEVDPGALGGPGGGLAGA